MPVTGWTQSILPYGASYAPGASIYSSIYAIGASIYSAAWIPVENGQPIFATPINVVAPVVSGTPALGETIQTDTGTWTGDEPIAFTYLWIRDTVGPIAGATSATYVVQAADLGYTLHCQVTGTNDVGNGVAQSNSTATVYENAPVNTVLPAISGSAVVGQLLTSSTGTWTSVTTPTYAYQWKRAGSSISGATSSTYTLVNADYGNTITVTVTATNNGGSTPATSTATGTVTEPVPVNTVAPVASGYVYFATTLSATTGTWTSVTTPTYTYQWKRGGSDISGATSSTYIVVGADEGQNITCAVTATNTAGAGSPATSNTLSSWIPGSLTMSLWLDANYTPSINSGAPANTDPITAWVDRSPNAVTYAQGTSGKRPTYATNQQNGRPAISFSNASQQNLTETTINTVSAGAAFTICVVAKLSSFSQAYMYMACFKASSSNPSMALSTNASYKDMFFGDDVSASNKFSVNRFTTISGTTSWHGYQIFYNGSGSNTATNYTGAYDSTSLTRTTTSGNDGATKNIIGSYKDSVIYNWNGQIGEVMVFSSQLTGSDLTNLQTYLTQKWGL